MAKKKKIDSQEDKIQAYCAANNIAYEILDDDQRAEVIALVEGDQPPEDEYEVPQASHDSSLDAAVARGHWAMMPDGRAFVTTSLEKHTGVILEKDEFMIGITIKKKASL